MQTQWNTLQISDVERKRNGKLSINATAFNKNPLLNKIAVTGYSQLALYIVQRTNWLALYLCTVSKLTRQIRWQHLQVFFLYITCIMRSFFHSSMAVLLALCLFVCLFCAFPHSFLVTSWMRNRKFACRDLMGTYNDCMGTSWIRLLFRSCRICSISALQLVPVWLTNSSVLCQTSELHMCILVVAFLIKYIPKPLDTSKCTGFRVE